MLLEGPGLGVGIAYVVIVIVYGAASWLHLRRPDEVDSQRWIRGLSGAGVALHGLAIAYVAVFSGKMPGFAESLSAVAFGVMVAYVYLGSGRLRSLGMFLAPSALIILLASLFVPTHRMAADQLGASVWLPLHIGLIIAAISGFFLEFFVGVAQFFVRRALKQKKFGTLLRFPPLDILDRAQLRALVFGLTCLALGIGAGGVWAAESMHHGWLADPKVWFTVLVWCWYALSLGVRLVVGWHGRWSMTFSVFGFVGLMFSIVGLDFVISGFHAYGG